MSDIDSSRQTAEMNAYALAKTKTREIAFDALGIDKRRLAQSDEAPTDARGVNNGGRAIQENRATQQSGTKPTRLKPDFEGMPGELKLLRQWVCWRFLWDADAVGGDGKWTKVPYIARMYWGEPGRPMKASTTDPSTWRNYDDLRAAYETSQSWSDPFDGVGFVFDGKVDEDGMCLCGLDFDAWTAAEQELCGKIGATYAEVSPGGSGVHVIARARPFDAATCKTDGLKAEAYCRGRYFTITGQRLEGGVLQPVEALPDEIVEAVAEIRQAGSAPRRRERERAVGQGDVLTPQSTLFDALPDEWDDLTYMPPEPLDIEKLSDAVWALPDALVADEGSWMNLLCRALANEAERANDPATTELLYQLLDARSRNVAGYSEVGNRNRFERCMKEYNPNNPDNRPILSGSIYQCAEERGWAWPHAPQLVGGAGVGGAVPGRGPQFGIAGQTARTPVIVTHAWLTKRKNFGSVLPYREWALGVLASYGEVTTIASPGGFGKTALGVGLALEAASGRDFLGHNIFIGPQEVLHISSEESEVELARRYEAASTHHRISQQELDRVSWRGTDAKEGGHIEIVSVEGMTVKLNRIGLSILDQLIQISGARVVILDPLNSFIAGGLNDNSAMGGLILQLKRIAGERSVAIIVMHHTSKGADLESSDAIMGASAIVNHSRTAVTLVRATTAQEQNFLSILPSQARKFFRLIYGKMNHALPPNEGQWYRQHSVNLGNGGGFHPHGDNVGVVELYDPASSAVKPPSGPTKSHQRIALRVIDSAPVDALLTLSNRGGGQRNVHKRVEAELRLAGVAPTTAKDDKVKLDRLIDSLTEQGLVTTEKEFVDAYRKTKMGLGLTKKGRKTLDGDGEDDDAENSMHGGEADSGKVTRESKSEPSAAAVKTTKKHTPMSRKRRPRVKYITR